MAGPVVKGNQWRPSQAGWPRLRSHTRERLDPLLQVLQRRATEGLEERRHHVRVRRKGWQLKVSQPTGERVQRRFPLAGRATFSGLNRAARAGEERTGSHAEHRGGRT